MANTSAPLLTIPSGNLQLSMIFVVDKTATLFLRCLTIALACGGVITNILSCVTFTLMGLKGSVAVLLYSLTLINLGYAFLLLLLAGYDVMVLKHLCFPVTHSREVIKFMTTLRSLSLIVYDVSMLITVTISVQQCICVAFPFRVKAIFTKVTSVVSVLVICVVLPAVHLPLILVSAMAEKSGTTNKLDFEDIDFIDPDAFEMLGFLTGSCLSLASFFLISINMLCIFVCLQRASNALKTSRGGGGRATAQIISTRDRHVTKCIILVCATFLSSNLMAAIFGIVIRLQVGLLMIVITYELLFPLQTLGACVNLFVYIYTNQKFRNVLGTLLSRACVRSKDTRSA